MPVQLDIMILDMHYVHNVILTVIDVPNLLQNVLNVILNKIVC